MKGDAGSVTVWTLIASTLVVTACGAAATVGSAVVVRHRAAAAADAAALAGATAVVAGPRQACARASAAAAATGARVARCTVSGPVVAVTVHVAAPSWLAWDGGATGSARAGPVTTYTDEGGRERYAS